MRSQPYQDERLASAYHSGNAMPAASMRAWVDLVRSYARTPRPAVLDVGTGTGMFAAGLADAASFVVGIDPSAAMLGEARRVSRHPRLQYAAGDAMALPVPDSSFDLALLSRVIHHVPDRRRCARELHRVLRRGGVVVIRTTLAEHLDALVYSYWSGLLDADRDRFPSLGAIVSDFGDAGLDVVETTSFGQPVHASLREFHHAMAGRPQSKFNQLTEEEFRAGLTRLRHDAERETAPAPVRERYDVVVFGKP